jgi:predicted metal-dependent hydrolase
MKEAIMPTITNNHRSIVYDVKRSDVAFIKIYIDDLNGVKVTTSPEKAEEKISAFVKKKADWIFEKWEATHKDLYMIDHLAFSEEMKIAYLGRSYRLILEKSAQQAFKFQKGKFFFYYLEGWTNEEAAEQLRLLVKQWLYEKATEKFPKLAELQVETEEDYTRLGTKTEQGIHLNWRLIQKPKETIQQTIEDLIQEKTC